MTSNTQQPIVFTSQIKPDHPQLRRYSEEDSSLVFDLIMVFSAVLLVLLVFLLYRYLRRKNKLSARAGFANEHPPASKLSRVLYEFKKLMRESDSPQFVQSDDDSQRIIAD